MVKHWILILRVLSLISGQICVQITLQVQTSLLTDKTFNPTKETAEMISLTGVSGFILKAKLEGIKYSQF
jgi:hypothetical protein